MNVYVPLYKTPPVLNRRINIILYRFYIAVYQLESTVAEVGLNNELVS